MRFAIILMVVFIFGAAFWSQTELTANNTGAPSMRTGSPGDTKSCTTCHIGTAQNVTGIMSTNVPPAGYTPGSTYIIDAVCTDATRSRFGFEISPQNTTGAKLGVLTITDATRTKLVGSGKYITHTSAGTTGAGTITWSFNWTAPPAGTGDVTFYGAFNFTNHNNASSGDVIKLSQITIPENVTTGIDLASDAGKISVYPNPARDVVRISLPQSAREGSVQLFSLSGELISVPEISSSGDLVELNVATLSSGTYFVTFATENGNYTGKLIKL